MSNDKLHINPDDIDQLSDDVIEQLENLPASQLDVMYIRRNIHKLISSFESIRGQLLELEANNAPREQVETLKRFVERRLKETERKILEGEKRFLIMERALSVNVTNGDGITKRLRPLGQVFEEDREKLFKELSWVILVGRLFSVIKKNWYIIGLMLIPFLIYLPDISKYLNKIIEFARDILPKL